jgi:hypothetical protein
MKIGAYPSMPRAKAREMFKRDLGEIIQKGRGTKIAGDRV